MKKRCTAKDCNESADGSISSALKSIFLACPSRLLFLLVVIALFLLQLINMANAASPAIATDKNGSERIISKDRASSEPVLYYTLRNHTGSQDIDSYYGDLRGASHSGLCEVSFRPTGYKNITSRLPFYISDTEKELTTIKEFSEEKLWQAFAKTAADSSSNRVVLYVHGYNINFTKGCIRAAVFQQVLDEHSRLLLFSWPSDGTLVSYTRDEADVEWSQHSLEQVIMKLSSIYGADRLNIVAHSLGSRGVLRVLQLLSRRDNKKHLNELVLLAPDYDADVFRLAFPDLHKVASRITLYSSENDQPLRLSNEVHGHPRLGEAGDELVLIKGMDTIDVSLADGREMTGHLYHLYNDNVRNDLRSLLAEGTAVSKRSNLKKLTRDGLPYWMLLPASD